MKTLDLSYQTSYYKGVFLKSQNKRTLLDLGWGGVSAICRACTFFKVIFFNEKFSNSNMLTSWTIHNIMIGN